MDLFKDQIYERQQNDANMFQDAFANLSSVLDADFIKTGENSQVDTAMARVLNSIGVKVPKIPSDIEGDERLAYILRETGVMHRRVELTGTWWKDANGSMLGSTVEGDVIAIIQTGTGRYEYTDKDNKTIKIDKNSAKTVDVPAFCFYRPFPAKKLSTMGRLFSLPAVFFRNYSAGELTNRAMGVSVLFQTLTNGAITTWLTAIFSVVFVIQMVQYAPSLVAPGLLTIILMIIFLTVSFRVRVGVADKRLKVDAKLSGLTYGIISGIQKIRLSGALKRAFAKWAELYSKSAKLTYAPPFILQIDKAVILLISLCGSLILYYFAGTSGVSPSEYMAFIAAFGAMNSAVVMLLEVSVIMAELSPVVQMASPILETVPERTEGKEIVTALSGSIEINSMNDSFFPLKMDQLSEYYGDFCNDMLRGGWESAFCQYPVLGRMIIKRINYFVSYILEIHRNIKTDINTLKEQFKADGKIVAIKLSTGDRHNHGRAVSILEFENQVKIVYKPDSNHSLKAFRGFTDLLTRINALWHMKLPLVLSQDTYSYVEFIAHDSLPDKDAAKRYFHRAGQLLCVMYMLGATDAHFDNVIASGEYPVLIDWENIMSPMIKQFAKINANSLQRFQKQSVFATGLLHVNQNRDVLFKDFGGIALFDCQRNNSPYFTDGTTIDFETRMSSILEGFEYTYKGVLGREDEVCIACITEIWGLQYFSERYIVVWVIANIKNAHWK